ncbi:branched-chain amino acid ABC transporter substrate-binding protein [Chryseobacterium paridis]|uniref:Branched-chain amino acid ABC transporter substrate-binding protein n=1 Tax=Chryseobacterium paridis TaxID=2800328 RepID=A0ABS1FU04_9FLAO|nr:branched-chain amino acid ABC transporter substrate-binding protein [Chryseobacterium paridis]MBK1895714.1 branched-chain amino acid ABC transporter substrate-binding protein [Chryseobacterium paridis]
MSWNIFEIIDVTLDALDLLGGSSTPNWKRDQRPKKRKKSTYNVEWMSVGMAFISAVILFSILKEPLPVQYPVQTMVIAALIGISISAVGFIGLYFVELFYFRNIFSMIFFCSSVIFFSTSLLLWLYFKSGLF